MSGGPDLRVDLGGIALRNPVLTASGTFGYGVELGAFLDVRGLGGVVSKSLTLEPRHGNLPRRIAETPAGMLNAIGLENVGVEAFLREKLPRIPEGVPVIASVFGTRPEEMATVVARLGEAPRISGFELNASCPHVKAGGIEFGQDPALLAGLVRAVRRVAERPLLVKLSPNVAHIGELARVCEGEGADAIALINTLQALDVDVATRRPVLRNVLGGLSGPAIRPVALRMVFQAARAVSIPICGIGGIETGEDAVKFLLCGATAVQVGTATYVDPRAPLRVVEEIETYCREHGVAAVRDLVGALELPEG